MIVSSMNDNPNLYQQLRSLWKNAHPEKQKHVCEKEVIAWYKENKNDKAIQSKISSLKLMIQSRGSPLLSLFAKNSRPSSSKRSIVSQESKPYNQDQAKSKSGSSAVETESSDVDELFPPPQMRPAQENQSSEMQLSNWGIAVSPESEAQNLNQMQQDDVAVETQPKAQAQKRPAQEKLSSEIQSLKNKILALLLARNNGVTLSKEQIDQLRSLKNQQPEMEKKLKRLQQTETASRKHREKKKRVWNQVIVLAPSELNEQMKAVTSSTAGRPSIERDQPGLLATILNLVTAYSTADERRRCETLRTVKTLDQLLTELKNAGFNISRTGLYIHLMPRNIDTREGKRHITTVPVKLIRAQNSLRKSHQDTHFAAATIKYLKDLAVLFGECNVAVLSQDDKCRVPLGLPAAHKQSPILMRMDRRVQLPDHNFVVATRHKLIPSVYAGLVITKSTVSYSGPTYIAIRSGKHDSSTAKSHAVDIRRLLTLKLFDKILKREDGTVKPILIIFTDGGPDENPRFPKTLFHAACHFKKFNLDALFIATHAPHQSASNPVERRMAPLSRDLCGVILPYDTFGSHLDNSGKTKDLNLEKQNFERAGRILADIWSQRVIDKFDVFAEYIGASTETYADSTTDASDGTNTNSSGETVATASQSQSPAADKEDLNFLVCPSFLTEKWKHDHVRQSQYLLQIVKCQNPLCCPPAKTNILQYLQSQFLPPPMMFKNSNCGPQATTTEDKEGHFMDLSTRLALSFLQEDNYMPFDKYCPSVVDKLKSRTCKDCSCYHPSKVATVSHEKIHLTNTESFALEDTDDECIIQENVDGVELDGIFLIDDVIEWLQPIFEEEIGSTIDPLM